MVSHLQFLLPSRTTKLSCMTPMIQILIGDKQSKKLCRSVIYWCNSHVMARPCGIYRNGPNWGSKVLQDMKERMCKVVRRFGYGWLGQFLIKLQMRMMRFAQVMVIDVIVIAQGTHIPKFEFHVHGIHLAVLAAGIFPPLHLLNSPRDTSAGERAWHPYSQRSFLSMILCLQARSLIILISCFSCFVLPHMTSNNKNGIASLTLW